MVTLSGRPLKVGIDIILAVAIAVQHVGQMVGVGHEGFGHEAMHFERLSLQPHPAVALAVVCGYEVPRGRATLWVGGAKHIAIARYEIQCATLGVK